jgi:hypothetical protein
MVFGTPRVQLDSTYRIAPANNRLQKNMYGTGYSEFMDYSVVDALPNPGYGGATGMPIGGTGNQDVNIDLLMQRMTDMLQNQFGLKPKTKGMCIHLLSQNGITGWPYRTGLKFLQISRSFMGKMIQALWNT